MAVPVIQFDQGAPGAYTYRPYFFQPVATNNPTAWTTAGSTLPPGLVLDTASGRISGTPTTFGHGYFLLQASNSDGASDVVLFAIGVRSAKPLPPPGYVSVEIELSTGVVTYSGASLLTRKSGDDLLQQITLLENGSVVDATVVSLKFGLKFGERDTLITPADDGSHFVKVGSGDGTVFRHAISLTGTPITDNLDRFGVQRVPTKQLAGTEVAKRITQILTLAEYEIKFANSGTGLIGPNPAVWTSQTVGVEIVREMIPNA